MFPLLLKANGLEAADMQVVNMPPESMVASLLQGQVDAILGSMDDFSVQLKNEGADTVNLPFIDNGAPTVAQSIIASNAYLKSNPEVVKTFVAASLKGWNDAIDSPTDALSALQKLFPEVNMNLAPGQLDATIYLMCANRAQRVGKASPEQWNDTVKILSAIGILPADIPASKYYSYDYLPATKTSVAAPLSSPRDAGARILHYETRENTDRTRLTHHTLTRLAKSSEWKQTSRSRRYHPRLSTSEPGEFVSVVGPSGCGKSTLLLMVAGLMKATSGQILIDGKSASGPLTDVGIAFQDHLLLDFRTAMDNVLLQADVRQLPKNVVRARAETLFAQLGLTKAASRYPMELSGGMRQRVSLVRSLVHEPSDPAHGRAFWRT